ncbi:acyl-CoA dehydrogenase family protein [Streptomyces sp. NPDC047525]|uniref:acyl-CoA dehydrogenase family protein n=1 Tax=Streptomyces sp. NPDC047525 TaxID=3155264 RepID=UPI0034002EAC
MTEGLWSTTPAEQKAAREVDARWGPLLADMSRGADARDAAGEPVPQHYFTEAAALGLQALSLPRAVGGEAMDPLASALTMERIGYLCRENGFPLILGTRTIIAESLLASGRRDLTDRYVIPVARGELGIALAYSEDADAFSMRTTLRRSQSGYLLSGHKAFTTGGLLADVFLVYANDGAGDIAACLVHREDPGVTVNTLDPVGNRTSGPASLDLRDVPLSQDRIVTDGDGISHAQHLLNARRLTVCCASLGQARALVELSAARLGTTVRHGQPLSDLPNVQAALGRMYIAVETARAMLYRAARRATDDEADLFFDPLVSAAKHRITDCVRSVVEESLQVLGGHFYYGDPYFGICLRDFTGLVAAAGTQNLLEVNLGALAATSRPDPDGPGHVGAPRKDNTPA